MARAQHARGSARSQSAARADVGEPGRHGGNGQVSPPSPPKRALIAEAGGDGIGAPRLLRGLGLWQGKLVVQLFLALIKRVIDKRHMKGLLPGDRFADKWLNFDIVTLADNTIYHSLDICTGRPIKFEPGCILIAESLHDWDWFFKIIVNTIFV